MDIPNFGALATQQKSANDLATNQTNLANRVNQYGPMGSQTYGFDPATGQWTQSNTLNAPAQDLFGSTLDWQKNIGSQVAGGAPVASFGAQQNVIDAWNRLQQPGLDQQAQSARARAAAQGGLGMNSGANTRLTQGINDMYGRAGDNAILQGVNAYNQMYTNQLNQFNANRGALSDLTGVRNSLNPNAWNAKTPESAAYLPQNIYGAGLDTFSSQLANKNADIAQLGMYMGGAADLGRAMGGYPGIKTAAGDLWSGIGKGWDWLGGLGAPTGGSDYNQLVSNLGSSGLGWAVGGSLGD